MVKQNDKVLADELVKGGLLTQVQADQSLAGAQSSGEPFHSYLIHQNIVAERQVLEKLSMIHQLAFVDLKVF